MNERGAVVEDRQKARGVRASRGRLAGLLAFALTAGGVALLPLAVASPAAAAPVGASVSGGPVVIDGTDAGLHGRVVLDGTGVPKASELRTTWIYELKAWETLLAGVPSGYANNGRVAIVGGADSTLTNNNCGAAAHFVAQRLAAGAIGVDYFSGATAIQTLFDQVLAGTANYKLIQLNEQNWCANGMDNSEAAVVNASGPAIAAHVNRGGALFAQSQSYGWLNSLFPTLSRSGACSGSSPALTAAGFAQFPGLANSDIAAPWHNCFVVSSGAFPLTQLALQSGITTVILGGRNVSLPSAVTVFTSPAQPHPGETVCATATVTSGPGGAPLSGATVQFSVDGVATTSVVTDASGIATYCYTATGTGEDDVTAIVTAGPGTGTGTSTVTWSNVSVNATPSATLARGDSAQVCVNAVVATTDGTTVTPTADVPVTFTVTGVNTVVPLVVNTDAIGAAQLCYFGPQGGQDTVTAAVGNGSTADSRSILINWTGAQVAIVDVGQSPSGSGKVVPITVTQFTGATNLYATLTLPAGAGLLTVDGTGLSLTSAGSLVGQSTISFSGTTANVTSALASRVTWTAPATPGTYTLTVTAADDPTTPTISASDTGTLTVTEVPVVTAQPDNMTVDAGNMAMFMSAASGFPAPIAQWQVSANGGTSWTDLSGETGDMVTFTATTAMNANMYRVRWINSVGNALSMAVTLAVTTVAPAFTDSALGDTFVVGSVYNDGVAASGIAAPTYSVTLGALPAGISLNPVTGAVTGSPTAAGAYSFTIAATNGGGAVTASFAGTVGMAPSGFTDTVLAGFVVGTPYNDGVTAADGTPAPMYSVTAGALPAGIALDPATGAVTGNPTAAGAYSFTISATNANGAADVSFSGTTGSAPSGFTDALLGGFVVDSAYSDGVVANGTPGSTYAVTAGALPDGIMLDAVTGAVTGTPTLQGPYSFTITATNANGTVTLSFSGTVVRGESGYMGVTPQRLFDSRDTGAKIDAGTIHEITVLGQPGVPDDATSVAINVTANNPDGSGFFTIYPCGVPTPNTSSGNFVAGETVANGTVVPIGVGGKVCVYTSATTQLVVDLNGVYSPSASQSTLHGLAPLRLFDSRRTDTQVAAGAIRTISVLGQPGVPADATAAVLNVTASNPDDAGFFTVYPCGMPTPNTSTVNFARGQTIANAATVPLGAGGTVCIYTDSTSDLIVDLNGVYSPTMGDGSMHGMTPERLLNTREAGTKLAAGAVQEISILDRTGVPDNSTVVELNVTATNPDAAGFLTVYPCGTSGPDVSNLNYPAGKTMANAATVSVGVGGKVCIYTSAATDLIVDLNGVQYR